MTKRGNSRLSRTWDKQMSRAAGRQLADHDAAKAIVRDAQRYRFLRDSAGNEIMRKLMAECRPEEWDRLVDAERDAQQKDGPT